MPLTPAQHEARTRVLDALTARGLEGLGHAIAHAVVTATT